MNRNLFPTSLSILHGLFFFSGIAALIYQLMWQRMLFSVLGVDLESITIIVSVFMFGLGMGGLWGGYLADKFTNALLWMYVLIEFAIAAFGFLSPRLIEWIGHYTVNSHYFTLFTSFLILSFPTIFMGATFPILVTYVDLFKKNIGHSVGGLYFSNTLGGAIGALLAGFILLSFFDLNGAVNIAVIINLSIALVAGIFFMEDSK
jgi:MFS family permease